MTTGVAQASAADRDLSEGSTSSEERHFVGVDECKVETVVQLEESLTLADCSG